MLKKVPHTYVIIVVLIVVVAAMTWVFEPGKFIKETIEVDGTEQEVLRFYYKDDLPEPHRAQFESQPQTWQVMSAIFNGFRKQSGIIVFILMIGGAFWIINSTKAIDVGILAFLKSMRKLEQNVLMKKLGVDNIIITMVMLLFSIFGAVFGMAEETIAFIVILVPLAISMGYDSITGVAMVFVGAAIGFAGAMLNPFTVGIAQGLAGIPLFTGIEFRTACWIIITTVGIAFVLRYVKKIRKNPMKSLVYKEDEYWRERGNKEVESFEYYTPMMAWITFGIVTLVLGVFAYFHPITSISIGETDSPFTFPFLPILAGVFVVLGVLTLLKSVHYFILLLLGYTIIYLIVGVMGYGWYIMEIATLFLAMGVFAGMAVNKSANEIAILFIEGVKDIIPAAMLVGLAAGIIVILEDGGIIDSILYSLSQSLGQFGKLASVQIMYFIQTAINIFIPSGSAKAAITIPIMAPFGDLIGISRQATVMAFQFGDGFTNLITPTSGVLIAVLGVARIPYSKWVRWVAPLVLILILLGSLLLIPTVTMDLPGF